MGGGRPRATRRLGENDVYALLTLPQDNHHRRAPAEEQATAHAAREARVAEREERNREQRQRRERDDSGRFSKHASKMTQDEFDKHLAGFGVSRYASLGGANR